MTTTDRHRLYAQTARQRLQLRGDCWYIVDGSKRITLGAMSIPQAAMKLRDYQQTWADSPNDDRHMGVGDVTRSRLIGSSLARHTSR